MKSRFLLPSFCIYPISPNYVFFEISQMPSGTAQKISKTFRFCPLKIKVTHTDELVQVLSHPSAFLPQNEYIFFSKSVLQDNTELGLNRKRCYHKNFYQRQQGKNLMKN